MAAYILCTRGCSPCPSLQQSLYYCHRRAARSGKVQRSPSLIITGLGRPAPSVDKQTRRLGRRCIATGHQIMEWSPASLCLLLDSSWVFCAQMRE